MQFMSKQNKLQINLAHMPLLIFTPEKNLRISVQLFSQCAVYKADMAAFGNTHNSR